MKICYLASSTLPSKAANAVHVMKMGQALALNGHEVTLIVPDKPSDLPAVQDVYAFYGVANNFAISKLKWAKMKGRAHLYGFLAAWRARSMGVDLVYGRNLNGCFWAAQLGMPTLFETHAPIEDSGSVAVFLFRRLIRSRHFLKLVVITHALADYYLQHYPELANKIHVAADGADAVDASTQPMGFAHSLTGRLQVGYVGHLYRGRGIELIEEMARRLPWADFHIVGGTVSDIQACRDRGSDLRNFFVHGYMSPAEAERYRIACDVLLAPYQEQVSVSGNKGNTVKWMSPLKIFEYMAAGKAIICSDIPVLREVLVDRQNALLCPPQELVGWISALEALRDDPELRMSLGRTALNNFEERYSWRSRAANIIHSISSR